MDFRLNGLQNLLVYKSQPPGLRDLLICRSIALKAIAKCYKINEENICRQMNELDLIKSDTLKDLLFKKFEEAPPQGEDVDPLSSGEFEVIKQLVAAIPEAAGAKEKIDKIIDKCGNPPRGVGIQNLRTCIAETKWKFDVSPEERQGAFKVMIINFIERYFYLICFCMYSQEHGPGGFQKQFSAFMEEKKELRQMATDGE